MAEFRALRAEIESVERLGLQTADLTTARRLASRFNEALARVPEPRGQQPSPHRHQHVHAHSKHWAELSPQERQCAAKLGTSSAHMHPVRRRATVSYMYADCCCCCCCCCCCAWTEAGWEKRTWDNDSRKPMETTPWAKLSAPKRRAAEQLGIFRHRCVSGRTLR